MYKHQDTTVNKLSAVQLLNWRVAIRVTLPGSSSQCKGLGAQIIIHHWVFSRTGKKMIPLGIFFFFQALFSCAHRKLQNWVGREEALMDAFPDSHQLCRQYLWTPVKLLWEHFTDVTRLTTATQEDKHMLGSLELVNASVSVLILLMLQQYS